MKTKDEINWDKFFDTMNESIQKLNKLFCAKPVTAKTLMLQFYFKN